MTLRRTATSPWRTLSGPLLVCLVTAACAEGRESETPLVVTGGTSGNGGSHVGAGGGGGGAEAPFCTTSDNAAALESFELELEPGGRRVEGARGVADLTFRCQFVGADGDPAKGCEPETLTLIQALGNDDDLADEEEALANCLRGCLAEDVREVSQSCRDCFAIQTACESRFCLGICQTDANYVCGECIDESGCLVEFQACSGLPPISARDLRTRDQPDRR
ncbi:MAG: hypothetical protein WBG86_23260 [Polyangiales bacterium]